MAQRFGEPRLRVLAHIRIDRQPFVQQLTGACGFADRVLRGAATALPGLTKSGVSGDTPPQSLMPAATICGNTPGLRFGGA